MQGLLLIPIIVFTCLSITLGGQEFIIDVQHYGLEEGLSHRNVHFSLQDQRGLLWFGTNYGLNRFDGYNFKWITREKHGLQNNTVQNALEDKDGLLWLLYGQVQPYGDQVADVEGIDLFDPISEKVTPFDSYFGDQTNLVPADIIHFTKKENGDLVFLTKGHRLVTYAGKVRFSSVLLREKYTTIYGFHHSSNGLYWMQVTRENAKNRESFVVAINEKGEEQSSFPVRQRATETIFFYQTRGNSNQKWISVNLRFPDDGFQFYEATPDGQLVPNADAALYKKFNLDFSNFSQIARMVDEGAYSCFVSKDGFFIVDKDQSAIYRPEEDFDNLAFANHLTVDQQENIWVSTQFGIYQITWRKSNFSNLLARRDDLFPARGLALDQQNRLWIIEESINNIWMAQLDRDFRQVIAAELVNQPQMPERLPFDQRLYSLHLTDDESLYYPSSAYSITRFNVNDFQYQNLARLENPKKDGLAWSLHATEDGQVWAGFENGMIGLLGEERSEWLSLMEDENFSCFIYQFMENDGSFWITTDAGLFRFDRTSRKTTARYWAGGTGNYHLPFDNLRHAYLEADSTTFWLATGGEGLVRFNTKTSSYQQFTKADGLSNNVIYAVYPDDFDNLWLPSDYGLMRFNKTTHQVNTYLTKDGISHHEFNRISHLQADNGTLFFGSLNGITAFHPEDFQFDSSQVDIPLVISQFQQFTGNENKLLDRTGDLLSNQKITLAPNDPFFRLEFGLLSYEDVDKIQYAYKIEGQDQDWNYQKENYIRLSRLPYGKHELRIKGQASNGQWSPQELSIQVEVLKPFYLQTWFLVLSAIGLIAGAMAFYRFRVAALKQRQIELEQMVAERTQKILEDKETIEQQAEELQSLERLKSRFFANVSHELRTPLTLMLGPISNLLKRDYWQEKDQKLLRFVQNNGKHLLKLVNEILDLSKLETGRLEVKEEAVHFHDFLQPILAQFRSFGDSESVKMQFEYRADPGLNILLDTNKFEKIVHNFLSNAIKFSPTGSVVKFRAEEDGDHLLVSVTDHGPGIHPDDLPHIFDRFYQSKQADAPTQGGTGIGLSLAAELAELLGGKIWVESELGNGSTFYFRFPKKTVDSVHPPAPLTEGQQPAEILMAGQNGNEQVLSDEKTDGQAFPISLPKERAMSPREGDRGVEDDARPTVLIVEDNPELRSYIQVLLEDEYHIITAENGKVAWEILTGKRTRDNGKKTDNSPFSIDLIISDLMMPVMDGFQLMEKVKASDDLRHIPYIMLTARADVRVKLRALRIGVDDYITKPFVEEELMARIENLLRNYEERKAFHNSEETEKPETEVPAIDAADQEWLENLEQFYLEHLDDNRLTVDFAAQNMLLSERQFHRQLKKLTGLTPNQYLREIRLNQARQLLENRQYQTVKETCHAVGFSDVPYFTKIFRERFGTNPSEFS